MKTHDEFLEDANELYIAILKGYESGDNASLGLSIARIAGALRGAYTDGINQSIIEQTKRLHRRGL